MICDFTYNLCTCWCVCVWVKKDYVKSALKRHLNTQFFYFFGKFYILKMIHIPFKVSVQCNNIFEIIATCQVTYVTHHAYSTTHSHTVYWRSCEVSTSHLQSLYEFPQVHTFHTDATRSVIEIADDISRCTRYVLGNSLQVKGF